MSTADTPTIAEFMSAVVPWPGIDDDPGHHIGMYRQYPGRDDRPTPRNLLWAGRRRAIAFRS